MMKLSKWICSLIINFRAWIQWVQGTILYYVMKWERIFFFLFVTNTFEMQIILCNILKGWGQTTKYIRWPQRIITTYTPSSLCLECIMGECSCIHCKIASFESAFYSFHLQILLLNLRLHQIKWKWVYLGCHLTKPKIW